MKTRKDHYESPALIVMEIETEGILCASGEFFLGNGFKEYEEEDWA